MEIHCNIFEKYPVSQNILYLEKYPKYFLLIQAS